MKAVSVIFAVILCGVSACSPTVNVATDKPIEINLNVKIEHQVRVAIEKDVQQVIKQNKDIF